MQVERGFTIIELVVAIVVLGIAVPPLLAFFAQTGEASVRSERETTAYFLAMEKIEEVVADRHASGRGYAYLDAANYPSENPVSGFASYQRSVAFEEVDPSDLETAQSGSGYMKATVTVSYSGPSGSYALSCVFCNLP